LVDKKALNGLLGERMFPPKNQTRHFFVVINEKGEIERFILWPSDHGVKRRSNG